MKPTAESVVLLHLLHPDQVLQGWLPFALLWAAGVNIHWRCFILVSQAHEASGGASRDAPQRGSPAFNTWNTSAACICRALVGMRHAGLHGFMCHETVPIV